jgi:uncharacterized membrane protein YhaH (DUF805 family)
MEFFRLLKSKVHKDGSIILNTRSRMEALMGRLKRSTFWCLVAMLIVIGPIYLIELLHVPFFATAKIAGIPAGGFLIWIYYLVLAVMSLVISAIINAGEEG